MGAETSNRVLRGEADGGGVAYEEGASARLRGRRARLGEFERESEREMYEDGPAAERWSGSSSSHVPVPSSTSSSLVSLMTTTSRPKAFFPSSMSIESLSPIQSIYHEG